MIKLLLLLFIAEYDGIRVRVENGDKMQPGQRYQTRLGDTVQVLSVSKDTVMFSNYVTAGHLMLLQ